MYSVWINRCKNTFNCSWMADCTLCFDCIDGENSYGGIYCQDTTNCSECLFSFDMIGCSNCFGCSGLRNKQFYIYNKSYSQEDYEKFIREQNLGSHEQYEKFKKEFHEKVVLQSPHKFAHIRNCENCTGDYIMNSKDCNQCFNTNDTEKASWGYNIVHKVYNVFNTCYLTEARNIYQGLSIIGENIAFCDSSWLGSNTWYCSLMHQCHNCFGSIGCRKKKYVILNKQYSKEDYEKTLSKLITHMQETGEWGKHFPMANAMFNYNESEAFDYYPMNKDAAISEGLLWHDEDKQEFAPANLELPDSINETGEAVTEAMLACKDCGRNYKVLPNELKKYQQVSTPVPRTCMNCRFDDHRNRRNPQELHDRNCMKCQQPVKSSYAEERPETIYCETCYLELF